MVRPTPHRVAAWDTDNVFLTPVIKGEYACFIDGYIGNLPKYLTTNGIESEKIAQCRNFDENVDRLDA